MTSRASFTLRVLACLLITAEVALFAVLHHRYALTDGEVHVAAEPVVRAVPEIARQRHLMRTADGALRDGDGATALSALETASFGERPVEIYRRYYLANALELLGRKDEARATLAILWAGGPRFARRLDVAFHLSELYEEGGDWNAAALVLGDLAVEESPAAIDTAYQRARSSLVASGDPSRLVGLARLLAVRRAGTSAGRNAAADLETIGVGLTRSERIERVATLAETGDAARALEEIERLRKVGTTLRLEQARAEVLARQGKRAEADRIVLAFLGHGATIDRELLGRSWRWWRDAASSIENRAWRNIRIRRRIGTTRVRVGGRWVDRPVHGTVTQRVKRSLSKTDRRRLEAVNRTLIDRGERLLRLDPERDLAREIHRRLAIAEQAPRRQDKLEEHVRHLVEIDPAADDMLQLLWDEGWTAWRKRELDTARERFAFIYRVYRLPSIQRQARYWYSRCLEESGESMEAARHFRELQSTPYDDVYSLFARDRTAGEQNGERAPFVRFDERPDDWVTRAEREMPLELRLAWELSLLGLNHDARMEVRANTTPGNRGWAYSILARIHRAENSPLLVSHTLRIAWPQIGTVEQDSVPVHFLRMYYPTVHHDVVEREASRRRLDPALVKALILQESAYDPSARSAAGAIGLMQLMAPTAREIAPRVDLSWDDHALVDPGYNVTIGTYYLRTLLLALDENPILSLAAYNGGIGNVRRWQRRELKGREPDEVIESIPFSETRGYVKRVILYRSVYERERPDS